MEDFKEKSPPLDGSFPTLKTGELENILGFSCVFSHDFPVQAFSTRDSLQDFIDDSLFPLFESYAIPLQKTMLLKEIMKNIGDHSEASSFLRFYKKENALFFVIGDYGNGIDATLGVDSFLKVGTSSKGNNGLNKGIGGPMIQDGANAFDIDLTLYDHGKSFVFHERDHFEEKDSFCVPNTCCYVGRIKF